MNRMRIREASLSDAPRLLEIYAYYIENTAITFEYDVPKEDAFILRMKNTMEKYPYLVAEENGIVQGYAYAGAFVGREAYRFSCALSIYLDHNARGKGYGRALYEALEARLKAMGIRICTPASEIPFVRMNTSPETANSSTGISGSPRWVSSTDAATNSAAGTI